MFNFSKSPSIAKFKKSPSIKYKGIIVPTLLALGLSACSSDVARFAKLDAQNRQVAQNNVQQSSLPPLNDTTANTVYGQQYAQQTVPAQADSQFTSAIPSSTVSQTSVNNNNWMGSNNPDTYRISTGDTLYSIARRFGLTVEALRNANNLDQNSSLNIGQQIFLPRKGNASFIANTPRTALNAQPAEINTLPQSTAQRQTVAPVAANAFAPAQKAPTGSGIYTVKPKDNLYSIARAHGVHVSVIKNLNGFTGSEGLRIGQQIRVSGNAAKVAAVAPVTPAKIVAPVAQKTAALAKPAKRSSSRFRWPVSGRVISEYGKKSDGRRNDGLNVAVPPGTVVKAAENGVVAYSGSGLKSYGNLILIKHDGGWVTAYAHNGSILVKKGDKIRRGQAIARSGQSGDVTKPQLHFEIRRGALAVNPRKYLSSN